MYRIVFAIFSFIAIIGYNNATAQQQPNIGCNDKAIRLQAEQMKAGFIKQGFSTYKDAMISMESRQPSPVAIQLNKGTMYQFIFIGDMNASKLKMELFDGDDNRIEVRENKDLKANNNIVYSFVPEKSDIYLVVLTQQWKTKSMCGSFTILQQAGNEENPENRKE